MYELSAGHHDPNRTRKRRKEEKKNDLFGEADILALEEGPGQGVWSA